MSRATHPSTPVAERATRPAAAGRLRPLRILGQPAFRNRGTNPYNWLLYTHLVSAGVEVDEFSWPRVLHGTYDVWHLHWPESYPNKHSHALALKQSAGLLALLRWARARGTKVVWTVHNLRHHDAIHPRLERWFWRHFLPAVDGYISLSGEGRALASGRFSPLRRRPGFVVPHGHYRPCYPNRIDKFEARRQLHIPPDATVLAFVGQIREYKDVPRLITTFRQLPDASLLLLVAGQPSTEALATALRRAADGDRRIGLHPEFLPDDQIQLYLNASDLVVLPYRDVLNSGSALLALSFDRPVLVPGKGALRELQRQVGPAWVRTYPDELTPGELARAARWAMTSPREGRAPLDAFSWEGIAGATIRAYERVLAGSCRAQRPDTLRVGPPGDRRQEED